MAISVPATLLAFFLTLTAFALASSLTAMAVGTEDLIEPMTHLTHSILLINYLALSIAPPEP